MEKLNLDPKRKIRIKGPGDEAIEFRLGEILVAPGRKISLKKDFDPGFTGGYKDKTGAMERVAGNVERMSELQETLYASGTHALLVIFQGMDAAGKDGVIRHVMSGVNPQGCNVTSFKTPSAEELDHDYLWRASKALPGRGMIGIFNRSYYEEVLVVRVHPEFLAKQKLPADTLDGDLWERRFKEIANFEKYLARNGIVVLKFFLNLSRQEQKRRFLSRIDEPAKNWKFSPADSAERAFWNDYQKAFGEMLSRTSTDLAPWFVIPADNKWFARLAVSEAICLSLERLNLKYPKVSKERRAELLKIKKTLEGE